MRYAYCHRKNPTKNTVHSPSEILEIYNVLCIVWVMDMFDCVERSKNTF